MALEAVVFSQDLLGCNGKELRSLGGGGGGGGGRGVWGYGFGGVEEEEIVCGGRRQEEAKGGVCGSTPWCSMVQNSEEFDVNSSSQETCTTMKEGGFAVGQEVAVGRRKRRRTKTFKNKEEVENQRMTHIAVERNRRKQMNEYLAVLRSLMPPSYVQRGDQASIIGGAINFVKELEQLLQSLEAQRRIKQRSSASGGGNSSSPFAGFFSFPQYSSRSAAIPTANTSTASTNSTGEAVAENRSAVADIEVTMVDSHANLKVLSRRRPKQVLKMVVGLQSLRLTALHLNVTTVDEMVLYSFSLKVEDDCALTSVDEIATAVYQMVGKIQDEAGVI